MVQVCHGLLSWSVIEGSVGYSCHLPFDIPVQVSVGSECFSFSTMMRRDVGVVSMVVVRFCLDPLCVHTLFSFHNSQSG